jgi:hypothetical protein
MLNFMTSVKATPNGTSPNHQPWNPRQGNQHQRGMRGMGHLVEVSDALVSSSTQSSSSTRCISPQILIQGSATLITGWRAVISGYLNHTVNLPAARCEVEHCLVGTSRHSCPFKFCPLVKEDGHVARLKDISTFAGSILNKVSK